MSKKHLFPKLEGSKLENFEPIAKVEQLQIIDTKTGEGEGATANNTVRAHYTGCLANNGTVFQSSRDGDRPISFSLNQVIEGWQEGLIGMKVGGIRRLIIPAAMAYGSSSPARNIPANSDLVFDIELFAIS